MLEKRNGTRAALISPAILPAPTLQTLHADPMELNPPDVPYCLLLPNMLWLIKIIIMANGSPRTRIGPRPI